VELDDPVPDHEVPCPDLGDEAAGAPAAEEDRRLADPRGGPPRPVEADARLHHAHGDAVSQVAAPRAHADRLDPLQRVEGGPSLPSEGRKNDHILHPWPLTDTLNPPVRQW